MASEVKTLPPHETGNFSSTQDTVFGPARNQKCEELGKVTELFRDESVNLPLNLTNIFHIFREEALKYGDTYNQHLIPVLEPFMVEEKFETAWYRLSGSSVWLKDYNVHLVVSRLLVSEFELQDHPRLSVLLAQVFDEAWNEIDDVRLVFPTNNVEGSPGFETGDAHFHLFRFPRILPLPFDIGQVHKYWGAEDPRMTLVTNKNGHQEPLITFNAFHVKSDIDKSQPDVEGKRSIFMSLPFQFQRGKQIEAADTDATTEQWFARTRQLRIEGEQEQKIDKNWVPFVTGADGPNEHVMFAALLDPLKVIRCDLWTNNTECALEHAEPGEVGRLRGGTPLTSVKIIEEEDREYFVGLARANLQKCGCGNKFYRPNIVVLARTGKRWKLTRVSSFVDLGMEIQLWRLNENVCTRVNAMIPNGIEFWDLQNDIMSVEASVSDKTVERVHLKGVLKALEDMNYLEIPGNIGMESPVHCALKASADFCKAYGDLHLRPLAEKTSKTIRAAIFGETH
ncbi:hypothetical protein METBIDRAFT_40217 [Metschnikowia bicuspidata var. bicuspidata NRRL YB-4993]|uniref:Uncharacterized protein n=1 Tax=Metschnikowia bicuspidata var. bicuspidata NRRL YB-4993 TaxID=869754 RepID=A0A1A0HDG7_9ASCO|nr:hypothetical protein METBIDRAFT_40217 [Metschnikowia bicuspidata var. bicuspidata NRRL YB-4993]OBA22061.1 hypothetical protein METBIDRAFT_40217 [Metschnikowia bicuspidata var. bicuspidata NRRL YB-4993]